MAMTTIETELIAETRDLAPVPLTESASITDAPAFPDAREIIARRRAADAERDLMEAGYREMADELVIWATASFTAQAETLPEE
jgi:hypothetical protein